MTDEWRDGDCPKVRKICGYQLRAHVSYQDGRHSEAPALIFADADYDVGDGKCGLHADGKSANEPAIVYARIDSLVDALARIETLTAERDALRAKLGVAKREILSASLFAAELAESIGPSGEWSHDFKEGYVFGGRDAARMIRQKCTFPDAAAALRASDD